LWSGRKQMGIKKTETVLFSIIVIFAAMAAGCGYSIHPQSALPAKEISIGLIENRTVEPKLQDKLQRALTEEFMKQGMRVGRGAGYKITGTVNSFELVGLSERGGVTVEYRVTMTAEFRLLDREGKIVAVKNISSPFIVALTDQGELGRLLAGKDAAEERAAADVAVEVVGAFMFK
jgi:hypothetical protein